MECEYAMIQKRADTAQGGHLWFLTLSKAGSELTINVTITSYIIVRILLNSIFNTQCYSFESDACVKLCLCVNEDKNEMMCFHLFINITKE